MFRISYWLQRCSKIDGHTNILYWVKTLDLG